MSRMPTSFEWLRARLTTRRRVAALAAAIGVLLPPVILVVGVAVGQARIAAVGALIIFALVLGAVIVAVVRVARRYRVVRSAIEGEAVDLATPPRKVLDGALQTPRAAGIRLGVTRARIPVHMVAAFGMSTRSPVARDQLAGSATGWRFDYGSLTDVMRGTDDPARQMVALGPSDAGTLLLLARMVASQELDPDDRSMADALTRLVAFHPGRERLSLSARRLLIERLAGLREADAAYALLGVEGGTTLAERFAVWDLLNPFDDPDGSPSVWLAAVNGMYLRAGLEGLRLAEDGPTPFDRLRSEPAEPIESPSPVVSVIMTCFRPDRSALFAAVLSILNQSWTGWELLIADDGSPAEFDALFREVELLDDRITVLRSETNNGTYVRRNGAIAQARGEFVTFLDSDDWAHPRRLQVQVEHLVRHPESMANLSRSARVTSGLRFLQERGTQLRLTEASLFFRREAVLARIGWFDSVRKAADTGYRLRIEAEFGRPVPVIDVEAPLTLVRYGSGSLSGSDLRDGWTHPARVAYSSALATWIQTERAAGRPPFLAPSPDPRPFPVHPSLLGRDAPDIDLDILYVVDVRVDRERDTTGIDREILEAADSGLRVGVRRAERLRAEWVSPHARRGLQEAINAGRLVEVIPGDPTAARLVLVPDASVLDGVPVGPAVRSGRVVVGRHPSMPGASIEDGVRRLTGTQAEVTDERGAREARRGLSPH